MKVAVFSDIHGNGVAFDAVLADLERRPADRMVCLGDAIQGGPEPGRVTRKLRELGCPVVMGNADAWLLAGRETGEPITDPERRRSMDDVRAWGLGLLSEEDREFISSFAPTVEIGLEGGRTLLCFHGSPASFDHIVLPDMAEEKLQGLLGPYAPKVLTGGHTHAQQVRRVGESFFFNPGSVGLSYSHHQPAGTFRADPWADYAVLTTEGPWLGLEFRRVRFDVAELVRVYRTSGRPHPEVPIQQYTGDGRSGA
jgi:putative phosphoesterase